MLCWIKRWLPLSCILLIAGSLMVTGAFSLARYLVHVSHANAHWEAAEALEEIAPKAEALQTILIQEEKLSGSPKEIVAQLNELAKKYDPPRHEGIAISFDPAVDGKCCTMAIFRKGEPLANWLQDVCESCGSKYRVEGSKVIIELWPLSDKQTASLEDHLPDGMAQLCRQFRSQREKDRFALGEKLFRLLPHSPETWSKEVPMHHFVSYDYEHPSYKLYKRDVLTLLGEPDRNVNNERFYYSLQPGGTMLWQLGVEFGKHEYVENPSLSGSLRK